MTLDEFTAFVDKTIDELLLFLEIHRDEKLSEKLDLEFEWLGSKAETIKGRENIIYEITDKVYLDENRIYPIVDLLIRKYKKEGNVLISGRIAHYSPRPFQKGWSGRQGSFIYGLNPGLINPKIKTDDPQFIQKLIDLKLKFKKINKL